MKIKLSQLIITVLLTAISAFAQTKVSGIVLDDTQLPVPYANVYFKDTVNGLAIQDVARLMVKLSKTV